MRLKKNIIYNLVEKGDHGSRVNLTFDYTIMVLIVLNLIAIIFESIPTIYDPYRSFFSYFELISVIIFSLEYIFRIYVSDMTHPSESRLKSAFKFIFSKYGLIDILAIMPFYLPFVTNLDLRFIRILRLMRFLRILKINRYNKSLKLIWDVVKEKKAELAVTGFVTLMTLLIASFLMYYIEGPAQPDKFPNIIASFWWAIATLTTVGYGDVYPITALGKFVSSIIAVLGIGLVALPTGMVSAGFVDKIAKTRDAKEKCPHCGKELH
ncbi:ion transporter [Roseimarinus sediminis]|uniref:ion transporter n=1 Tax=Roseimarinus sediminis TaxID=1610899 RepID=UPI003D1C64E2